MGSPAQFVGAEMTLQFLLILTENLYCDSSHVIVLMNSGEFNYVNSTYQS